MQLTFASYNIHKAVGLDGKRDADRIIRVLTEVDADVIALQEADLRFGQRAAVLPRYLLDEAQWVIVPLKMRPRSMGWHGNSILVRKHIEIVDAAPIHLPSLEPRGAIHARFSKEGREFDVVGMHLDLSGLLRRKQIETVCGVMRHGNKPTVIMGDLNEWSPRGGALRSFGKDWKVLAPGRSFPGSRPLAPLDRIVHSPHWDCANCEVHHSALAVSASDHLPVRAELELNA
ncbi:endonuclease/exonuclease/phosphatase family protein [Alteraurantiacibacter aquimixticola]|uniref:Endonuclease n=1 Tax=Alteraurantiacibacter aquimixticola TaxID=2489173 RepID=A0A4T3F080_9SPHN|nr:endonuclease/exonuclease/phosphatase family protein [Alteraurantiacibacter aquimixticola]TIX49264.1 endonuclease [Alteraurantiacibacter aquimixticola]